jgi:exopolysaccharide biosynthesis polyprenyl glycosylphosphotransferase
MRTTRWDDGLLRVADLAVFGAALPIAFAVHARVAPWELLLPIDAYGRPLAVIALIWSISAWLHRVYDERPRAGFGALPRVARAFAVVVLICGAAVFVGISREASRIFSVEYFAVVLLLLAGNRLLFRAIAITARRRGYDARRYAVVGSGAMAREVVEAITSHPEWGWRFVGFVRIDAQVRTRGPVLGSVEKLDQILQEHVVDEVIFAVPRDRLDVVERAVPVCEELGVQFQISLDVLRFGQSSARVGGIDGIPTLKFTRTPTDTLALGAKRVFDVIGSGLALVLLSPMFAAVALAIRLESPGPVFFRQRRSGLNGRVFDMLKFRSMYVDAEARLEALKAKNEMSGPVFKMANDPRVTQVGRFLRRTSLDEFPQFWNVLRGEMSIVGPRPPIPAEVRQYKRWQRRRLSMKPGITCIWQISGRNNIDFDHWMELDLEYIDHWSLWTDLEICLKTVPAVILARGAR